MSNLVMLTAPTFRTATQADAEAVAHVYLASRKQLVSFAPLAHSDEDIHRWIRESLIPTGQVTVAQQEGKIIGMMALSTDETANIMSG